MKRISRRLLVLFVTLMLSIASLADISFAAGAVGSPAYDVDPVLPEVERSAIPGPVTAKAPANADNKISLNATTIYGAPGMHYNLELKGAAGRVKWSTSKKSVATVSKSGKVTFKRTGRAVVKAAYKGKTYSCKVICQTKSKLTDTFAKVYAKSIKKQTSNDFMRALLASAVVMYGFKYGNHYTAEDLVYYKTGTCVAGSKLVAKILNKMGYKAKCRFAAKDKMSRYPQGVIFGSQHHNVEVVIKGKKYYVDGNPGLTMSYLCSTKEPLYYEINGQVIINKLFH